MLTRTRTRSTSYIHAYPRITVEIVDATITIVSGSEVSTINTGAGFRVTIVRVSVALAALAMREVPETGIALTAGSAVGVGVTLAATGLDVTEIVEGTNAVAVAGDASFRTETVRSRRAAVATSANHVRLARTHSAVVFAQKTARARWVTLAS